MNTSVSQRIAYTVACCLVAVLLPYWALFFFTAIGMYLFDWYVEGLLVVIFQDMLFGVPLVRYHHFLWMGLAYMIVVFVLIEILKGFTRYGNS